MNASKPKGEFATKKITTVLLLSMKLIQSLEENSAAPMMKRMSIAVIEMILFAACHLNQIIRHHQSTLQFSRMEEIIKCMDFAPLSQLDDAG